jgi:hypothetical protein
MDKKLRSMPSGYLARLSSSDYLSGGYSATTVHSDSNGFVICRWVAVFQEESSGQVQLWKEHVGFDGSYRCAVLKSRAFPTLSNSYWLGPTWE